MLIKGEITGVILDAAIQVHKALGPGLLEKAYEKCLAYELSQRGLSFVLQAPVPLTYNSISMDTSFYADLIVEGSVIVELKSVKKIEPVHQAQLLTYMRIAKCEVGLLINFNRIRLKEGYQRFVL